jgi:hypothetical protein
MSDSIGPWAHFPPFSHYLVYLIVGRDISAPWFDGVVGSKAERESVGWPERFRASEGSRVGRSSDGEQAALGGLGEGEKMVACAKRCGVGCAMLE